RSRFPRGFLVVAIAHEDDEVCGGAAVEDTDWLWEAAVYGQEHRPAGHPTPPAKALTLYIKPALSSSKYALASGVTLVAFLVVFLVAAVPALLPRAPCLRRFAALVAPRAVPAPIENISRPDGTQRRRHDSEATFDSSDMSDSDNEEEDDCIASRPTPRTGGSDEILHDRPNTSNSALTVTPRVSEDSAHRATDTSRYDTAKTRDILNDTPQNEPDTDNLPCRAGGSSHVTSPNRTYSTNDDVSKIVGTEPATQSRIDDSDIGNLRSDIADVTITTTNDSENVAAGEILDSDYNHPRRTDGSRAVVTSTVDDTHVVSIDRSHNIYEANRVNDTIRNESTNEQTQVSGPFGLPARLHVAVLARHRQRVLTARADRYLTALATVAVFYALPVLQLVFAFQLVSNASGWLDVCYYNFLCAHPAGVIADFNHIVSNAGYLLLGALFMLQAYGLPAHYGLLSALGLGMMVVALLSAAYHVCPNGLNFQFDTSFMYVLAVLSMVRLYAARHPDVNARAHATFAVLAALMALVVWGVLGSGALFWGAFTALHIFSVLLLSLRIYYLEQFRFGKQTLQAAARALTRLEVPRPLYAARLALLVVANALNWAFALYGLFSQSADFASHLLFVLLGNTLLYMVFYVSMKLTHGERPRWYSWALTGAAAAAWGPALWLFTSGSSSWAEAPARSRLLNHDCLVLHFYDRHDLWHLLSALALYLTFSAMLTWDDGLSAVPRDRIAVF
ncbi:hypothetical protein ACJJTC_015155, partial [Scirpophaga incertulas]